MLEIENLRKDYGGVRALRDIALRAEHGRVLGLLGPNGAGKSTTMNIVTGLIPKSGGTVRICGIDMDQSPKEARRRVGYLPEHTPLPVHMTVKEFLEFSSDIKGVPKAQKKPGMNRAVELTGLSHVSGRLIRNLSKGYKQRVGIAQALIGFPEVLILDEPTSGLDALQLIEIRALVRTLGREHTVLFSSHILSEVESVCDSVAVLYKGRVLFSGAPGSIAEPTDERVNAFRLTAHATREQVAGALARAGIDARELEPQTESLEDMFVRLIAEAGTEAAL